jgi:DNA-binding Lrp family transcriptional regulator
MGGPRIGPPVAARTLVPEPLDLAILREMYRGGAANLAGMDPRLNATRIARNLRTGRARVAARLKLWQDTHFLTRYDVWLNPALFGFQGAWVAIQVASPRVKPELFERIGLIDGVVSGLEYLGDWMSVGFVTPDAASLERTLGLVRGLSGVIGLLPPDVWALPTPRRELSPLDVRIVQALRERPASTLSETARRVGISTKTMTRRYTQLIDDWDVWFVPVFDFRAIAWPVVFVELRLNGAATRDAILRQIRARYFFTLNFESSQVGPQLGSDRHVLVVLPPSAAHLEEVEQFLRSLKGVGDAELTVIVRSRSFPNWFDRHLESLARRST